MTHSNTPAHPGTLYTHAGRGEPDAQNHVKVANPAVYRASTVLFDTIQEAWAKGDTAVRGEPRQSTYGTTGTDTTFALAEALEHIEGQGHAVRAAVQPSGLSAITTALQAFLNAGDNLLMADTVYGPGRLYALNILSRFGVTTTFFDPTVGAEHPHSAQSRKQANTKIVFLESPGSYTMELPDVPALCAWARAQGLISMIDNTWGSPLHAKPFDWGVDISLLALTKYWAGHSDVLMGGVVVREQHWQRYWLTQRGLGICVGGDDAYLVLRGLRTAEARMKQIASTTLGICQWLRSRPQVGRILNPALAEHPQNALFKRDFKGVSGLFSFEIKPEAMPKQVSEAEALGAICNGRKHFCIGYSWGGYESLIMPARIDSLRTTNKWIGGPLIRLNIGLEHPADLMDDLADGFAKFSALG